MNVMLFSEVKLSKQILLSDRTVINESKIGFRIIDIDIWTNT